MKTQRKTGEQGFTLVELIVALALFALISLAGVALIESIISVEQRTAGRLERLGQLQRTMYLLTRDFEQMASGTLEQVNGGVTFERQNASVAEPASTIAYSLQGGTLLRQLSRDGMEPKAQLLMEGVAAARWSFFFPGRGWAAALPSGTPGASAPAAIAVELDLQGSASAMGTLRRVVELPAAAPEGP